MLNVSEELKTLYKTSSTPKYYDIYFPSLDLHINTTGTNDHIVSGSFSLEESICSETDLTFGLCEASYISFTVADIEQDLTGLDFIATQSIGSYTVALGSYLVDTCKKQDDKRFKDITAYDRMKKVDIDVAAWYQALFPTGNETYTLAQFRTSFLTHVGLTEDTSKLPLPNDSMIVSKTINPESLDGRMVIEAIEEINGVFGHINRSGQFTHIILSPTTGLYPALDLYPSVDLYPVAESDTTFISSVDETISESMRKPPLSFEEYAVKAIDKLIIRTDSEDIGSIVGTGTNAYIIEGNFLVYGKNAAELETIAINVFGYITHRSYRPYESDTIGLPYIEPGDLIKHEQTDSVIGYVLRRTLKGIQSLQDEFSAPGLKERTQNTSVNKEIIILKGKTTRIQKDVDGVRIEVEDLEQSTSSQFQITAQNISAEVTRATQAEGTLDGKITVQADRVTAEVTRATGEEGFLLGQIDILADSITLKVDAGGVISAINLSPEEIKLSAARIKFEGLVTANNYFKILEDGSIEAVNGKFTGKLYLTLNSNDTAIIGSNGVSSYSVLSYSTQVLYDETYNSVVLGDVSVGTKVSGANILARSSGSLNLQGSYVHIGSYHNGLYYGVRMGYPSFYPTTDDISLGEPTHAWSNFYTNRITHKSGGYLGFFGATPVTKTTVSDLSTGSTLEATVSKVQDMINVLQAYGLF